MLRRNIGLIMSLGRFPSYCHSQCGVAGIEINKMSDEIKIVKEDSVSGNQVIATGNAITSSIDWSKFDGSRGGSNTLQLIQRAFQGNGPGGPALTRWLLESGWVNNPRDLMETLGYPYPGSKRIHPDIDELNPIMRLGNAEVFECPEVQCSTLHDLHNHVMAARQYWTPVGYQTLRYLQEHPERIPECVRGKK